VGLCEGQAGGETGAEVGAVDVGGTGACSAVAGGPEIGRDPGVAEVDVVERGGPLERDRGPVISISLGSLPPVVDDGDWIVVEA
jgi:hypothetical protein